MINPATDRVLAGERVEQARFADAVSPEYAGDLARFGAERNRPQRLRGAVMEIDAFDIKHVRHRPR